MISCFEQLLLEKWKQMMSTDLYNSLGQSGGLQCGGPRIGSQSSQTKYFKNCSNVFPPWRLAY